MDSSGFRLPPLPAIRVFEAVARHLSFTKAAAELGVTQAAVSYQIKQLEDRVGTALFRRLTRKLALTETGQRMVPPVRDALGRLADAFAAARSEENSVLRIKAIYSFATNWVVPRLGRFTRAYPQYSVRLETAAGAINSTGEQIDIEIGSDHGQSSGLVLERLMPIFLTPMVSPALLASIGGAESPLDLLKLPLLRGDDSVWEKWFALTGHTVPPGIARGPQLDTRQIMGRAAIEGQGVALLVPEFFSDEIVAGRLVQPFPQLLFTSVHYCLAYAKSRQHLPKIQAFRSWILGELATDGHLNVEHKLSDG
jgi:LysR family glycine cleavage system transcriptional activator